MKVLRIGVAACCLALLAAAAGAQALDSGSITGVVRDTSGAVMPGVTVEASSAALIEKVRVAVTDSQGVYRITDLRPGAYTVTFSLPGFATFRREGVELTASFTATVNGDLKVGALEETVTVSGAAPVVDTQNVVQQKQFARAVLDAVPMGTSTAAYAALIPGAVATQQDVGGTQGVTTGGHDFIVHGGRVNDFIVMQDGMQRNTLTGTGATAMGVSIDSAQEVNVQTSGIGAETAFGGVLISVISKDGGNSFSGQGEFKYTNESLQMKNVTQELLDRGMDPARPGLKVNNFISGGVGGPIKQDKMWFYSSQSYWNVETWVPGVYWNATHGTLRYTPDLSRPAADRKYYGNTMLRLTLQATPKQKLTLSNEFVRSCTCTQALDIPGNRSPEATQQTKYSPNWTSRLLWTYTATNKLLLEAGGGPLILVQDQTPQPGQTDAPQVTDLSNNFVFNARSNDLSGAGNYGDHAAKQFQAKFSVSYVTGSHAFKTGFSTNMAWKHFDNHISGGGLSYNVQHDGTPVSLVEWVQPHQVIAQLNEAGLYAQDQWTIRNLTLNLGLRFDRINGYVPAMHLDAGPLVPARDYPEVRNSPNWRDIAPRIGAAYNLFGNGKTAVKAFLGRYVALERLNSYVTLTSPATAAVLSANRTWGDSNRNGIPDCVLTNTDANGECGRLSDSAFGQPKVTTTFADDVLRGSGNRNANWQSSVSFQHEFLAGLAVDVGYYRTWYANFTVTENTAVTPTDFTSYCITAPVDSRLPNNGGYQVCGLYDVNPASFGRVNSFVELAPHFGKQSEVYNGIDLTVKTRFGKGGQLSGGLSTARTETNNCGVVLNNPQRTFFNPLTGGTSGTPSVTFPRSSAYCDVVLSWANQTQVKFILVYPLPMDLQASATFQSLPGIPIYATYVAGNAQIAPSLGRNLSAGANGTVTIDLIEPNTRFEDRLQQVDFRLTRTFRVRHVKLQGNFDAFNVFNSSAILTENYRFGAQWMTPTAILGARLFKFGVQVSF